MNEMQEFTALYAFRKYGDTVLRAAYSYTGSYSEAEDITQDVFLGLHSSPQKFRDENHLRAWLLRAAINRSRNYHKSSRKRRQCSYDDVSEAELSYEFIPQDTTVRDKLNELPEKYRAVLHLYYYEDCTIREIAEILQKSENTISSQLQRARKKLRLELEEDERYETV